MRSEHLTARQASDKQKSRDTNMLRSVGRSELVMVTVVNGSSEGGTKSTMLSTMWYTRGEHFIIWASDFVRWATHARNDSIILYYCYDFIDRFVCASTCHSSCRIVDSPTKRKAKAKRKKILLSAIRVRVMDSRIGVHTCWMCTNFVYWRAYAPDTSVDTAQ